MSSDQNFYDMLGSISWGQFTVFMLALTAVYYAYVVGRYYRREVMEFLRGKGRADPQGPPGKGQGELFVEPGGDSKVLFKMMDEAVGHLKGIVAQGVASKMDRENLLDHMHQVLLRYGQLRGTPYEGAVNNFIARTLSSSFSLVLGETEVKSLWY